MSQKRAREHRMYFHFDNDERTEMNRRMEAIGISNRDAFIRKMVLDGYIINIDMTPIIELVRLVRISSSNIKELFVLGSCFTSTPKRASSC